MTTAAAATAAHQKIEFCLQIGTVSKELADWAEVQFAAGRSLDSVRQQLRRVIRAVTPLREAAEPIADNVTRTETEFNLNWAHENPELFAQAVKAFQTKAPITHWAHHIDLSREQFMTLIAVRRDKPFDSVMDYVMADKLYLRETGYDV
jgi:hypothetical protein